MYCTVSGVSFLQSNRMIWISLKMQMNTLSWFQMFCVQFCVWTTSLDVFGCAQSVCDFLYSFRLDLIEGKSPRICERKRVKDMVVCMLSALLAFYFDENTKICISSRNSKSIPRMLILMQKLTTRQQKHTHNKSFKSNRFIKFPNHISISYGGFS